VSDLIAIGAMSYLEGVGLHVGIDLAVTGFDDHPLSEFLRPPLSSLRQPIELLARQVIDLLMAEIEKRPAPERRILLAPTLVIRESSSRNVY
jgi:DNA-binding LacI/PurR family transcriptional regulator